MKNLTPLDYAKMACDSKMRMPAEDLPPKGIFHYHAGVFLRGMQKTYELCHDRKYYDYAKKWVDSEIREDGTIINHNKNRFDDLMAGCLLFMLDKNEQDNRYKKALDTLTSEIEQNKFCQIVCRGVQIATPLLPIGDSIGAKMCLKCKKTLEIKRFFLYQLYC